MIAAGFRFGERVRWGRAAAATLLFTSVLVPVLASPPEVSADTLIECPGGAVVWDGGGGDGDWSTAANWTDDTLPGVNADVCILDAGATVALDTNAEVDQLVSDGALTIESSRTLTVNGDSEVNGALVISGDVGGAGSLSISGVGSWLSGELSGDVVVTASGVLDIPGSTAKYVTGSLTNRGTVTQAGRYLWTSKSVGPSFDQGVITNESLWRLESNSNATVISGAHVSYPGSFVNASGATLERVSTVSTAYAAFGNSVEFTNNGTVSVTSGELRIDKVTAADDGIFDAATDAKLELTGSAAAVNATPRFTGQGTVTLKGDYVLDAAATVDAAMVAPGALVISGDVGGAGTLSISGIGSWLSGELSADLVLTASGVLDIPGTFREVCDGVVDEPGDGDPVGLRPLHVEIQRGVI